MGVAQVWVAVGGGGRPDSTPGRARCDGQLPGRRRRHQRLPL